MKNKEFLFPILQLDKESSLDTCLLFFFIADERDPKKRKVKPVERHLLQVDFGLSDSENDSDFEIQEHDEEGKFPNCIPEKGSLESFSVPFFFYYIMKWTVLL